MACAGYSDKLGCSVYSNDISNISVPYGGFSLQQHTHLCYNDTNNETQVATDDHENIVVKL